MLLLVRMYFVCGNLHSDALTVILVSGISRGDADSREEPAFVEEKITCARGASILVVRSC